MDQAHIHLAITHLPLFASFSGILILLYGIKTKSNHTQLAAFGIFIISAIGACIAYATGEGAEEKVEDIPGIIKSVIDRHEDSAIFTLLSFILTGIVSIAAAFLNFKKYAHAQRATLSVLVISVLSFILVARTAWLGGQIRHTEISTVSQTGNNQAGENTEDEDE